MGLIKDKTAEGKDLDRITQEIVEHAKTEGSTDDISIVILNC